MSSASSPAGGLDEWLPSFRCRACSSVGFRREGEAAVACHACGHSYVISGHTVRAPVDFSADPDESAVKAATGASFAFEWERFGDHRAEWERNFLDYLQPHQPDFFAGLKVLDAGSGSGRHSAQAARFGARVVAVDIGESIDTTRANTPESVVTIQSDLEDIPLAEESFDLVMSIGVLHHLPNTERALNLLVPLARPGGLVRIYLYWEPELAWHRFLLKGVSASRRVTKRMPHGLLLFLCYPLAVVLSLLFVWPYSLLRRIPGARKLAEQFPLKTYADYPFMVLVNDQFDRFSAPIERRYDRAEVEQLMRRAGLVNVETYANAGWVAEGERPA